MESWPHRIILRVPYIFLAPTFHPFLSLNIDKYVIAFDRLWTAALKEILKNYPTNKLKKHLSFSESSKQTFIKKKKKEKKYGCRPS